MQCLCIQAAEWLLGGKGAAKDIFQPWPVIVLQRPDFDSLADVRFLLREGSKVQERVVMLGPRRQPGLALDVLIPVSRIARQLMILLDRQRQLQHRHPFIAHGIMLLMWGAFGFRAGNSGLSIDCWPENRTHPTNSFRAFILVSQKYWPQIVRPASPHSLPG